MSDRRARLRSLVIGAATLVGLACGAAGGSHGHKASLSDYVAALKSSDGLLVAQASLDDPPAAASSVVLAAGGGSATFLRGGSSSLPIDPSATRVIIAVADVPGYWELAGLTPGASQSVLVTFGQKSPSSFTLRLGTGDDTTISAYQEIQVTLTDVRTGAVQVNVTWDLDVDLDLHVRDPAGAEIDYENRWSASGGHLDLDSNVACNLDHIRAESVSWPSGGAPTGTYQVLVDYFDACTTGTVNYIVTVNVYGNLPLTFTRSFTDSEADRGVQCFPPSGDTMLCGTSVASFVVP